MQLAPSLLPNIAFFDSGQGGLTIWETVVKRFPLLHTQYLGDNARLPYGNKGEDIITRYASEAALFLGRRNAQLMIIACGTASCVAARRLQHIFKFPVVGIVEGFCKFVGDMLTNKTQTVAVLATRFTIDSKRFEQELSAHGIQNIWARACPLFVPLVEEGIVTGPIADATCDMYLWDIPKHVGIVMLSCTHYPRLVHAIASSIARHTQRTVIYKTVDGDWTLHQNFTTSEEPIYLMDPSISIVQLVGDFLKEHAKQNLNTTGEQHILCTDSPKQFERAAKIFTNLELKDVEAVDLTVL